MRDTQRAKLYRAEDALRRAIGDVAIRDKIAAWAFIEKVERDAWFRRRFGRRQFRVLDGRGTSSAWSCGSTLNLPRWSRTPVIMLHEVAHCVAPHGCRHGWEFAAVYLKLVRHFLGREVHDKLRASFRERRVRYKKPRVMSPAQRAAFERFRAKSPLSLAAKTPTQEV